MGLFSIFSRTKPQPHVTGTINNWVWVNDLVAASAMQPPPDVAMLDALCAYIEKHGTSLPNGMEWRFDDCHDWILDRNGKRISPMWENTEARVGPEMARIYAARQRWATAQLKAAMETPRPTPTPTPTVPKGRKSAKGKR